MFYVSGEGLFPAVLDLSTLMSEKRASLLANKGFVVLAVTVYTDVPDNVKEIHLDRFKEAVDFLQQLPKVSWRVKADTQLCKRENAEFSVTCWTLQTDNK